MIETSSLQRNLLPYYAVKLHFLCIFSDFSVSAELIADAQQGRQSREIFCICLDKETNNDKQQYHPFHRVTSPQHNAQAFF